jgi:HTH-type transcriptional regulator, sugar sensing transcriptional regulator
MSEELAPNEFQRFWRKLQQMGLNSYEARSYLVLVGHPRFKALELAARAHVPRQKIYEVLGSLVEKGFARVVQDKTKLFSAVEPSLSIPGYLARRRQLAEHEMVEQTRLASGLMEDLAAAYSESQEGRGTLDYLHIVGEPTQSATLYRRMIAEAKSEYLEFSRPPFAVDPIDSVETVVEASRRGVSCRLLADPCVLDDARVARLRECAAAGVQVRQVTLVPLKLALFDGCRGLIALLDPVITKPAWTALVFDHPGLGEAMKGLFEEHWRRSLDLSSLHPAAKAEIAVG